MQTKPHVLAVLQPPPKKKKECGSFAGKTNRHPEDEISAGDGDLLIPNCPVLQCPEAT